MRVRKLDANGDFSFGNGPADYWQDQPEGVAQLVSTRLQLNVGDWFLQTDDGMPWRLKVLGRCTDASRDPAIKARILGTQGVTAIKTYQSQVNRQARSFSGQVTIGTVYGPDAVTVPQVSGPNV
ncbi:hypothetical protein I3A86_26355, partial [Salmonella enterica]|nr:hypothetical protein [Salmonella enterica]